VSAAPELLITGGGTGGHVSPGLGVAAVWQARRGAGSAAWVGRPEGVEQEMAERAGLAFHPLDSAAFKRQWTLNNLAIPGVLLKGLRQGTELIRARRPAAVLMTGGYVGLPLSLAALRERVPLVLLEPNAVPGLANRLLKPLAAKLCLAYPPASPDEKCVVTGTPCRPLAALDRAQALANLGLDPAKRTLLVLPGSQAARAINASLRDSLEALADKAGQWQWIWMGGTAEMVANEAAAARSAMTIQVRGFIQDVGLAYAACDLVLCRSGASTLAELGLLGLPSLQVPYPHATGDHQRANACVFAQAGAARMLDPEALSPATLQTALRELLDDPGTLARMAAAARGLGRPGAAERVVDAVELAAGLQGGAFGDAHA
jgi:UDP-N-acetylglucosamine--N-acetylmuramyl-(pentapeptide) pyrophosphoryl-undecaprenol N-acetylglucosamine transferase